MELSKERNTPCHTNCVQKAHRNCCAAARLRPAVEKQSSPETSSKLTNALQLKHRCRRKNCHDTLVTHGLQNTFCIQAGFGVNTDMHQDFVALLTEPLGDHYSKAGTPYPCLPVSFMTWKPIPEWVCALSILAFLSDLDVVILGPSTLFLVQLD